MNKLLAMAAIVVVSMAFSARAEPPCAGDPDGDGPEPAACAPCDSVPDAPSSSGCYVILPGGDDPVGATPVCVGGDASAGAGCVQIGVNHVCSPFGVGCTAEHCAEAAAAACAP